MKPKIRKVTVHVSGNFFDNIFEKERKGIQKQLGLDNLSQVKFTEILASSKATIKLPKNNFKFMVNPNIKIKRRKRRKCLI
jgi:hypothetical protein